MAPSTAEGGGALVDSADIWNCIFWDNTAPGGSGHDAQVARSNGSNACPFYSDVEGFTVGNCNYLDEHGNIDENPKFVNPSTDDYRIVNKGTGLSISPCLGAGNRTRD